MAINCDDIFNQINDLRSRRDALANATEEVNSINPDDLDPKTQEDVIRRSLGEDPEIAAGAAEDVAKKRKSNRLKGRFNNAEALVNRIGDEQATSYLTLLKGMDETWRQMDPEDYARQVAAYTRAELVEALNDAADTAGLDLNDGLINAVQANVAPFLPILRNQANLKVFAEIARSTLIAKVDDLKGLLETGNYQPGELNRVRAEITNAYLGAKTAQRGRNIARSQAGRLLRNERELVGPMDFDPIEPKTEAPGTSSKTAEPKPKTVEVDPVVLERIKKIQQGIEEMIGKDVGATAAELATEGSVLRRIVEAANKGKAGVPELEQIKKQIISDAEFGDDTLDAGFDYERFVKSGYKDSILGGLKSIIQNNYVSQKMVFIGEGLTAIPSNAARIYVGNRRSLVGTSRVRRLQLALTQGTAAATRANLIAESVIKQPQWKTFTQDMFEDYLPFAGNTDRFNNVKGQLSIEQEYATAAYVAGLPWPWQPQKGFKRAINPYTFRDKIAWGSKAFTNHWIEKFGGPRLPVLSILKTNSIIDNRAGLRTFMTDRANELQLEYFASNPEATAKDAQKYVMGIIDKELYSARATPEEVASYRQQFNVPSEITDDQIKATIVYSRVGQPILDTDARATSFQKAKEFRMQGDLAQEMPGVKQTYNFLDGVRKSSAFGDSQIPFLKSWAEQTAWDFATGGVSTIKTFAEIADVKIKGGEITPELAGKFAGAATTNAVLLTLFFGMEFMGDDAPIQLVGQPAIGDRQAEEALRAQGKMPNSIFIKDAPQALRNLPFGNMPYVKTLMIYKDLKTAWQKGTVSDADWQERSSGLLAVMAGLVMRAPGLYAMQWWLRRLGADNFLGDFFEEFIPRQMMSSVPTVGVTRTIGQLHSAPKGTDWNSVINNSRMMEAENDIIDKLPSDHPLKSIPANVQRFLANGGTPELFRLAGGRDRKYSYLGRKWNGLPFLPGSNAYDWPDGVPALEIGEGDYGPESELDRLGKYNPPPVFDSHMLSGVPVTPTAINELELLSGTSIGGNFTGEAKFGGGESIRQLANGSDKVQSKPGVSFASEIRKAIKGNTWREALNAWFTSDQYRAFQDNPATTNLGSMSDEERNSRPGSLGVDIINRYFTDLLEDRFVEAGANNPERFPGAAQYIKDRRIVVPSTEELNDGKRLLRDLRVTGKPAAAQ